MIEVISEHRCFGGVQGFFRMESAACAGPMAFSVYVPPHEEGDRLPVLYWLSGLTCTEETFAIKAGAQRIAAELGLVLVNPDTSPRKTGITGATEDWDFGEGAGFYLDASEDPWSKRFNMETFVVHELPAAVADRFPVAPERTGIFGHSMGGHGALTLALRHPGRFRSVSAFAPIVAPTEVPWGRKAFPRYLGEDPAAWAEHDACRLIASGRRIEGTLLIDQGLADPFLAEQLRPELLEQACAEAGQALKLRRHEGYDHSYYFIATFIEDHLRHHASRLGAR